MRIVLHTGMAKAGSTALQAALVAHRRQLRKRGILYPKGAFNQNFLIAGISPDDVGRMVTQRYAGDAAAMAADFRDYWNEILDTLRRRQPSVLVLSAEQLFGALARSGPDPLRRLLAPVGGRLEIVNYVRRPSDYYLSLAQQQLKASSRLPPTGPVGYRRSIETAMAVADSVSVVPYDRSQFPGGDIVVDFAQRFLPEAEGELESVDDPKVKTSMSGEAMAVVQAFRRDRHPGEDDLFTPDTGLLVRRLAEREAIAGGQRRPQLLTDVRNRLDHSCVDLIWLRDTWGIVFDGIDYGAIAPASGLRPEKVAEICVLDSDRHAALAEVAASFEAPTGNHVRTTFRALPRRRDARSPDSFNG